jgi:glucan 1,3-beta-glucosidase
MCADCSSQFAFANPQPVGQMDAVMAQLSDAPCQQWAQSQNKSMDAFGLTVGGEFSLGLTDCGTFVSGVNRGYRYEGTFQVNGTNTTRVGSCEQWTDYQQWDQPMKDNMQHLALASMDALQVRRARFRTLVLH